MKAIWTFQGSIVEWQLVKVADSGGGMVANFLLGIPGSFTRNREVREKFKSHLYYIMVGMTKP